MINYIVLIIDCQYVLFHNIFNGNTALNGEGGAIYHDMPNAPPANLVQNKYNSNQAVKWQDYN